MIILLCLFPHIFQDIQNVATVLTGHSVRVYIYHKCPQALHSYPLMHFISSTFCAFHITDKEYCQYGYWALTLIVMGTGFSKGQLIGPSKQTDLSLGTDSELWFLWQISTLFWSLNLEYKRLASNPW